jgi:hypothetical protein
LVFFPLLLLESPAGAIKAHAADRVPSERSSPSSFEAAGSCPKPNLNWDGVRPTSVTGPFLPTQNRGRKRSSSSSETGVVVSNCRWNLTFAVKGHDPSVAVYTGQAVKLVPGGIDEFNDGGATDGVTCAAYYQLDNGFGGAAAQAALASTSCNTNGFTNGEGSVTVVNGNLQTGPTTILAPTQSYWYESYVEGASVLVGQFTFCSQDPVGQHKTYACIQFDAGPYV